MQDYAVEINKCQWIRDFIRLHAREFHAAITVLEIPLFEMHKTTHSYRMIFVEHSSGDENCSSKNIRINNALDCHFGIRIELKFWCKLSKTVSQYHIWFVYHKTTMLSSTLFCLVNVCVVWFGELFFETREKTVQSFRVNNGNGLTHMGPIRHFKRNSCQCILL